MSKLRNFRRFTNKEESKVIIKKTKLKVKRLWLLMITFIFSTFAWFTYMKYLQPNALIHVAAWKIEFKDENGEVVNNPIRIDVENLYPGMKDIVKKIKINNLGEKESYINYDIEKLNLIGKNYVVKDKGEQQDTDEENTVYKIDETKNGVTTVDLLNDSTKYPFDISFEYTDSVGNNSQDGYFTVRVSWPYEAAEGATNEQKVNKNVLDTKWGYDIANYYNGLKPEDAKYGLQLELKINAKQMME